jgi:hypothetical protein
VSRCCARNKIRSNEVNVKRERLTQIVLVIVGLFNLALIYFLYMDLRHSSWLLERKNECEPMFLSFFIPVGVFLPKFRLSSEKASFSTATPVIDRVLTNRYISSIVLTFHNRLSEMVAAIRDDSGTKRKIGPHSTVILGIG